MVFKIDKVPLPFDYVAEFNYYYFFFEDYKKQQISNNVIYNLKLLTKGDMRSAYLFLTNYLKTNYKFYRIFAFEEFEYNFLQNKFIDTYISFDKNGYINNFINIYKTTYNINKEYRGRDQRSQHLMCETHHLGIDLKYFVYLNINVIHELLKMYCDNFDVFLFVDTQKNRLLINELSNIIIKGGKTYIQLYNYSCKMDKTDIGFS